MPQPFIQASAQNANGGLGSYLQLPPVGGGGGGGGGGAVLYPDMLHNSKLMHFWGGTKRTQKLRAGTKFDFEDWGGGGGGAVLYPVLD